MESLSGWGAFYRGKKAPDSMSRVAKVHLPDVGFGGIECEDDLPAVPGNSKLPGDFMGSKREDLVHFARLAIYEVRLALIVENKSAAVREPVCPLAKWREPLVLVRVERINSNTLGTAVFSK